MTHRLRLHADLTFSIEAPSTEPAVTILRGTVTGHGPHVDVTLDDLSAAGVGIPGGTRRTWVRSGREAAATVAGHGLTLTLRDRKGPLVTVGAVRAPVLTRLLTRSTHLRIDDWSRALRLVRTRRRGGVIGLTDLLPPGTPWPPWPTSQIRRRTARTAQNTSVQGVDATPEPRRGAGV